MIGTDVLSGAHWLWCGEPKPNTYAGFAKQFDRPPDVRHATISLFADTKYKLYVNGRFVNAGPAPFRKPVVMVDTYDIAPYLVDGVNTVFVLAHYIGADVKYNTVDRPGVIAAIQLEGDGGTQTMVTDSSWRTFPIGAWNPDTPRKNWAIEHVEDVEMGAQSFQILSALASDDYAAGDPVDTDAVMARGGEPTIVTFDDIEFRARMVPALRWKVEDCPRLETVFRTNTEVYNLQDTAVRLDHEHVVRAWDHDVYEMVRGGHVAFRRRRGEKGYALLYDMRRMCAGEASFEIESDAACTLDLGMAEETRNGRPNIWRNGGLYYARFHLQPGLNRCRFYHFNGFRFLYLVFKDLEGHATVRRVTTHHCRADLEYRDAFDCEDRATNAVYGISRRSIMLNTQANSYDCNTREQGAYWGDALWALDAAGHMTGDFSHMRHMCYAMTDEYEATGALNSSLFGLGGVLYDYCLVAVDFLRRYYSYTGDVVPLCDNLKTAEAIVDDFRRLKADNGLIALAHAPKRPNAFRHALLFLDHPGNGWHPMTTTGIDRDDYNCGINLFYLQALQALQDVYDILGMDRSLANEIDGLRRTIHDTFYMPDRGLLTDARHDGKTDFGFSQIVNALGVMTEVLPGNEAIEAMLTVVDIERHPWVSQGTPYTYFFICEALALLGIPELGIATIKRYWTPMLDRGATTTWEAFGAENHDSLNHAWSAPLPYLVCKGVMGISPAEPGYGVMDIDPGLRCFDDFSGRVVIPQGPVTMAWTRVARGRYAFKASVPESTEAILHNGVSEQCFTGQIDTTLEI